MIAQDGEANCNDGSKQAASTSASSSIALQANLTDLQLQKALAVRQFVTCIKPRTNATVAECS